MLTQARVRVIKGSTIPSKSHNQRKFWADGEVLLPSDLKNFKPLHQWGQLPVSVLLIKFFFTHGKMKYVLRFFLISLLNPGPSFLSWNFKMIDFNFSVSHICYVL